MLPTGKVEEGRGFGAAGVKANLPLSLVLNPRLVTHWNEGATFIHHAQGAGHMHASSFRYNFGQSLIFVAHPRINLTIAKACPGLRLSEGNGRSSGRLPWRRQVTKIGSPGWSR
jgi:hypothetical protein